VIHFCVLIPCYNDAPGLVQSLQSIQYEVDQFAVVVVDDGSAVPVDLGGLKSLAPHIRHLHLIRLPQNSGITIALNTGLRWIMDHTEAPYIARLDCRDTCHPQRFYKQVTFLNTHASIGLLGTWCTFREAATGRSYAYTTPLEHEQIINAMHLCNVFIHPCVMFRTALLKQSGLYPYDYSHAEDYALFWSMLQVTKGAVLGECLMDCAITQQGLSLSNRKAQLRSRRNVVQRFGSNTLWKLLGFIKLSILLIVPNPLLLRLKTLLAGVRQ
jgi:glycosyltransferase involved in cell wall biosynthesis